MCLNVLSWLSCWENDNLGKIHPAQPRPLTSTRLAHLCWDPPATSPSLGCLVIMMWQMSVPDHLSSNRGLQMCPAPFQEQMLLLVLGLGAEHNYHSLRQGLEPNFSIHLSSWAVSGCQPPVITVTVWIGPILWAAGLFKKIFINFWQFHAYRYKAAWSLWPPTCLIFLPFLPSLILPTGLLLAPFVFSLTEFNWMTMTNEDIQSYLLTLGFCHSAISLSHPGERISGEKMPPSDWPVTSLGDIFLAKDWDGRVKLVPHLASQGVYER